MKRPRGVLEIYGARLRLVGSFLVLLLAVISVTGCRPEPRADLVIVNGNEPESLDPAIVTGIPEMRITKSLFEGLVRLDPKTAEPVPALAERWDISPDGRTYTFHLRTNAQWSTGGAIASADVLYSWLRALSPATAGDYAGQFFYIRNVEDFYFGKIKDPAQIGIQAPSPYELRVELNAPVAFFWIFAGQLPFRWFLGEWSRPPEIAGCMCGHCRGGAPFNFGNGA